MTKEGREGGKKEKEGRGEKKRGRMRQVREVEKKNCCRVGKTRRRWRPWAVTQG